MRRALPWILGGLLVIAAGAITAVTPDDESLVGATVQRGSFGDTVESRTLIATASDATFADELAVPSSDWSADGNWLIVTVVASAPTTEVDSAIQLATLVVGDRVFHSSERPSASLKGTPLRVGIDTVGTLAFELPPDVTTGTAELRLTTSYVTPELDDLVAIPFVLDDLERTASIEFVDSGVSAP